MNKGRVLASGDLRTLKQSINDMVWRIPATGSGTDIKMPHIYGGSQMNRDGLVTRVLAYSCPAPDAVKTEPTLEDVYLYYMHQDQLIQNTPDLFSSVGGHDGSAGGLG
jgi:hypothetical protein